MMKSDASHAHLAAQNIKAGQQLGGDQDPANMSQQHSVLNAFDFAAIDEMDPALGKINRRPD
jgi:hypothetical protein